MTDESSGGSEGVSELETGGNGSSGNGGNSGSNGGGESKPQHVHNWVVQTTVVHHDTVYETVHHDAVMSVECNGCHAQFNTYEAWLAHSDSQFDGGNYTCGSYTTYEVSPVWDEQILVSDAWDETITTGYICSGCGAIK